MSCGSTAATGRMSRSPERTSLTDTRLPLRIPRGPSEIEELTPLPGEYVIEKIRMSAFIGTELDLMLRTLGITELVMTGVQTPNCIRTTVFDAIAYNYPVILVDDATGAQSEEIHRANVRDMANIGVRVMDTRTLIGCSTG